MWPNRRIIIIQSNFDRGHSGYKINLRVRWSMNNKRNEWMKYEPQHLEKWQQCTPKRRPSWSKMFVRSPFLPSRWESNKSLMDLWLVVRGKRWELVTAQHEPFIETLLYSLNCLRRGNFFYYFGEDSSKTWWIIF